MITLDDLQKCIFPLIDKEQATPLDKLQFCMSLPSSGLDQFSLAHKGLKLV